jgi:hypothetical protein
MASESKLYLCRGNAAAIITHGYEATPPLGDLNADLAGIGIDGVLDELFDHGGGPFDHLTRRDLGGDLRRELLNGHRMSSFCIEAKVILTLYHSCHAFISQVSGTESMPPNHLVSRTLYAILPTI